MKLELEKTLLPASRTPTQPAGAETLHSLALSPDGRWLALTTFGISQQNLPPLLRLYALPDLAEKGTKKLTGAFCRALAFTPDGLVGTGQRNVAFFDVPALSKGVILKGHREDVHALAISRDGKTAMTCSGAEVIGTDCSVRAWSLADGRELSKWSARLTAKSGNVTFYDVAIAPDGAFAVACHHAGEVWGGAPGSSKPAWVARPGGYLSNIAFSADGREVWAADATSNDIAVVAADTGALVRTVHAPAEGTCVASLPTGLMVCVGGHRSLHVWLLDASGTVLDTLDLPGDGKRDVAIAPDGEHVYLLGSTPYGVHVINVRH